MLVLSRHVGEWIVIDGNIRISVVAVQGGRVRLGVMAPNRIAVDRLEVSERRAAFAAPSNTAADPTAPSHNG